jgi:hypothetical protein
LTHIHKFKDLLLQIVGILEGLNEYLQDILDLVDVVLDLVDPLLERPLIAQAFGVAILRVRS